MGRKKISDAEAFSNLSEDERSQAMWHHGNAEANAIGIKYHSARGNDFQADDCRKNVDTALDGWNAAMETGRRRGRR